jgi:hypothetical protein
MEHVLIDANTFPADNASTSFSPCRTAARNFWPLRRASAISQCFPHASIG